MGDDHDRAEADSWGLRYRNNEYGYDEEVEPLAEYVEPFDRCAKVSDYVNKVGAFLGHSLPTYDDHYRIQLVTAQAPIAEETPMSTPIAAKKRALEEELERLQVKLSQLNKYPSENPFEDGDIIKFTRFFPGGTTEYNYAGVYVGDKFYLTSGTQLKSMTWTELVDWLGSYTWKIEKATAWEIVVE